MSKDQKKHHKQKFARAEWMSVFLIFIIAIITGYFFMIDRLQKAETELSAPEQVVLTETDEGLDANE